MAADAGAAAEAIRLLTEALDDAAIFVAAELRGSTIVLSGEVESEEERQAALDLAHAVGDRIGLTVEDATEGLDIEPEELFGNEPPTGEAADSLPDEVSLEELRPDFQGDDGTSDPMESAAEAIPYMAPTDPVVRPVDSPQELEIVGGFASTSMDDPLGGMDVNDLRRDDAILADVVRELREDAATIDLGIRVTADRGVVTLRGEVPNLDDAENAESVAGRVPGVVEVREELRVAGLERRPR